MLRAFLPRRPPEPSFLTVAFDDEIYEVRVRRHAQARRYTLRIHAASREIVLRCRRAAACSEATCLRRSTAPGSPRGSSACRSRRRSRMARSCRCAASTIASSIARRARRGLGRMRRRRRAAALRRRRGAACVAPRRAITSSAKPRANSRRQAARAAAALGVKLKRVSIRDQTSRWGSCSTTGVLSYSLAADPGAAFRARLSGRARGRAPRRNESFARASGVWSSASIPRSPAPRPGSTPMAAICIATARPKRRTSVPG